MKFITLNIDFFISPAYWVPPIRTILRVKSISTKTLDFVPSTSGIASKSLMHITVNSGSWFSNSSFDGLINNCLAKRLCQAWSLITLIGSLFSLSAPTNPSKTNSSFPET